MTDTTPASDAVTELRREIPLSWFNAFELDILEKLMSDENDMRVRCDNFTPATVLDGLKLALSRSAANASLRARLAAAEAANAQLASTLQAFIVKTPGFRTSDNPNGDV